ncbi:MAG: adventurous gliding motility lipoprotein CglD [Pseudomonadota bacterium]
MRTISRTASWANPAMALIAFVVTACPDTAVTPGSDAGPRFDAAPIDTQVGDVTVVDASGRDSGPGLDTQPGVDHRVDNPDPNRNDNDTRDSDCDGLSDAEEYGNIYGGGGQTQPGTSDSDGDGILDGVEVGRTSSVDARCTMFVGDQDTTTTTDPTRADSDGDGLSDGQEDSNRNGRRDPGELDPRDPDTDDDGLCDGPTSVLPICTGGDPDPFSDVQDTDQDGVPDTVDTAPTNPDRDGDGLCDGPRSVAGVCQAGEDLNGDGVLGAGETDPDRVDTDCDGLSDDRERALGLNPRKKDTDGDLIPDGIEAGMAQNPDATNCTSFVADADPATTTDGSSVDSDGDGINDGIEDANRNGRVDTGETDPNNPDTDGDGICDGPPRTIAGVCTGGEDLNANGHVDPGETDPLVVGTAVVDSDGDGLNDDIENAIACLDANNADSDGDGLPDGVEDSSHDGRVQPGETDPCDVDSDCDGLVDGASYGAYTGEVTVGTQPTNPDTDGDGLGDGLEVGITGGAIPPGTDPTCGFVADSDPLTNTNPNSADSDNDGVPDGAEDANQNGRVDCADGSAPPGGNLTNCPGGLTELNPNDNSDTGGPVIAACGTASLVPVDQRREWTPDLQLATAVRGADAFAEMVRIDDTSGSSPRAVGLAGYNPDAAIGYVVLVKTPAGGTAAAEETDARNRLAQSGALSAPITFPFTSWDGYSGIRGSYAQSATRGVKAQVNDIVHRFFPTTSTLLSTAGDVSPSGGYQVRAEYLRRSNNVAVVLIAIIPDNRNTGRAFFTLDDTANGSALAQYGDTVGVQCDRFVSQGFANVDFLWAVDNSGSMDDDQAAVASFGTEMGSILNGSTMDWRVALVTSEFHENQSAACQNTQTSPCRNFTTNPAEFTRWFTDGDSAWITVDGSGTEAAMYGAQLYIRDRLSPTTTATPPPNDKIRRGAYLVIIVLTDAEDQRTGYTSSSGRLTNINDYTAFFTDYDPAVVGNQTATLGGILCAPGQTSGCDPTEPYSSNPVIHTTIQNLGGVIGDLKDTATIRPTILQILANVAGATSPYVLTKPAISSTVKVALAHNSTTGTCNWDDVPRDRSNGFDYDPLSGTIVFYGNCRPDPAQPGSPVVVSYRYWTDRTPDPDGPSTGCDCTPPEQCDPVTLECYCPPDCGVGTVPPEQVCDTTTCQLGCRPDCGASCPGNSVCNASPSVCACECPQDCGGAPPSGNFVCDRSTTSQTYCEYVCTQCPGTPTNPTMTCNPSTCTWTCPACGNCPGLSTCSQQTCACECSQSLSCGPGYRWDATACDCVCDTTSLGCGANFLPEPGLCACVCGSNCNDQCVGSLRCNQSLCACVPIGG